MGGYTIASAAGQKFMKSAAMAGDLKTWRSMGYTGPGVTPQAESHYDRDVRLKLEAKATAARGITSPASAPAATSTGGGGGSSSDLYQQALGRLAGGGLSLEADLAGIEAGKREAIGRGEQNLVSAGLSGTTIMGSVPLSAEKGASMARLSARGRAEEKYLAALTNFANLAFQAEQGKLGRESSMQQLQMQLGTQERLAEADRMYSGGGGGNAPYVPLSERTTSAYSYGASLSPDIERGPTGSGYYGNYSSQFPSIYDQENPQETPNWM